MIRRTIRQEHGQRYMAVNSHWESKSRRSSSKRSSKAKSRASSKAATSSFSAREKAIAAQSAVVESLLGKLDGCGEDCPEAQTAFINQHVTLKHLNSFGKQLVIRMFRSSDRFRVYKVDFDHYILPHSVLFLIGTLCESFDYANTSPLFGINFLDVGCGALSRYSQTDTDQDLLAKFHSDRPPITAEMMQMLGAKTIGVDPRENSAEDYTYQVGYRHLNMEFEAIAPWLKNTQQQFDIISGLDLFSRQGFLFNHATSETAAAFLKGLRRGLASKGLLYVSPPYVPSSAENRCANRRIFTRAGFRIVYEGYFIILQKVK